MGLNEGAKRASSLLHQVLLVPMQGSKGGKAAPNIQVNHAGAECAGKEMSGAVPE